ncbi:DUF3892 domain-containing protein [Pectobacterium carotovorum]|uniref:DUF3892 domain-containing protein n=1 Tax=Pectobacterium carotovorum TaxID=554 RepID=UPI0038001C10
MPDFYISSVRYDSTGQHIEWVKTHKVTYNQDKSSFDTAGSMNSRKFVTELISSGKVTFKTVVKKADGSYSEGEDVRIVRRYLTTDPNNTTKDNLGELPKF